MSLRVKDNDCFATREFVVDAVNSGVEAITAILVAAIVETHSSADDSKITEVSLSISKKAGYLFQNKLMKKGILVNE